MQASVENNPFTVSSIHSEMAHNSRTKHKVYCITGLTFDTLYVKALSTLPQP